MVSTLRVYCHPRGPASDSRVLAGRVLVDDLKLHEASAQAAAGLDSRVDPARVPKVRHLAQVRLEQDVFSFFDRSATARGQNPVTLTALNSRYCSNSDVCGRLGVELRFSR
jgi:hypothetical protein